MYLSSPRFDGLRRRLPLVHFAVDSAVWTAAFPLSMWLRYDYDFSRIRPSLLGGILAAVALQGLAGWFYGQYRRRWRYGSFDEVRGVALAAATVGVMLSVALWPVVSIPRSVPALATGLSLLGQVTMRSLWRLFRERETLASQADAQRLVIVGAGDGATMVLRTLRESQQTTFTAVALLDDDPAKRNLRLGGVAVAGPTSAVVETAERFAATAVLIAVPSASSAFIRAVTTTAEDAGLDVFVLPPVDQLFGAVSASDIRPVTHEDLLGRRPAEIDSAAISGYITGRRVMVTGAGGSIGREICRQLTAFSPAELQMVDRDESGLHGTQLAITGRALLDDPLLILADIRDERRVDELFHRHRPDVVFHTAALKHMPLLEMYPEEGWKTNVGGTLNLLRAAHRHGVSRFVNVSTDKAAAPTNTLGYTKRITERLTAWAGEQGEMHCVSVRFGNVLGSNGSVLTTFQSQAEAGDPITVTHPDVTRFFMTVTEASRLTIHAGGIGAPGELMILDMGAPVRIVDVARRFAAQHEPPLEIVFTGLRPNEKLHEALVAPDEVGVAGPHPLITHVRVDPLAPDLLGDHVATGDELARIALSDPRAPQPTIDTAYLADEASSSGHS